MPPEELHAHMKAYAMGWTEVGEYLEAERRDGCGRQIPRGSLGRLTG